YWRDWSSDVCSSDLLDAAARGRADLLADDLAKQAPEEPPVLAQQNLLVFPGHEATISEGVASREPASANNNATPAAARGHRQALPRRDGARRRAAGSGR